MDPLKKDQEWLGDDKLTPGSQDDLGNGGNGGLDTEGLTERQINQVAGLKSALDARDADISLIEEHGLRFVADKNYILDLPEDVGRKLIDRLKRTKSISIDMEYDDIIADLNGWGGSGHVDPNKVADLAVKRMTAINEAKETDSIVSKALEGIEDTELKTRFQQDYADLSGGKKLAPAVAKKLTDTILNGYRFEIQSQNGARDRALGMWSSGIAGTRMPGSASAQSNSRKNYDIAVAQWWSDGDLAKYYPEFHTPKK